MSRYFIENTTEFDYENLIFGDQIIINENLKKIFIYYNDIKPKEITFKLPTIRIIFNNKNLKYNQIKIPIYPLWDQTNIFLKFIKKIEKYIQQKFKINKDYINSLEKKNNLSLLKININENIKNIFNNLNINSEIEGVVIISYIWIKENSWGLNLSFTEFKYLNKNEDILISNFYTPKFKTYKIDFVDDDDETIEYKNKDNKIPDQINKPIFKISQNLLKETMTKLKKIE